MTRGSMALAQWSPGISLTWALVSLAVGALIAVVIVVRLWRDYSHNEESVDPERE